MNEIQAGPVGETEAQRLARLDRVAGRFYTTARYARGTVTKRYRQDLEEISSGTKPNQAEMTVSIKSDN